MSKQRVVRFKDRVEANGEPMRTARRVEEILKQAEDETSALAANEMTLEEACMLVDQAAIWDAEAKETAKRVTAAKDVLKVHAGIHDWRKLIGLDEHGEAIIKPRTVTTIEPWGLARLLSSLKKQGLFDKLFKVNVQPAKKYLGEDALEEAEILEYETDEFGSITLKRT